MFDHSTESPVQIVSAIAEDRLHLPACNLEEAAAMHDASGDQAVYAAVGREDDAADEDLRDEDNLVERRVLHYEEYIVAEVWQWYLCHIVFLDESVLQ